MVPWYQPLVLYHVACLSPLLASRSRRIFFVLYCTLVIQVQHINFLFQQIPFYDWSWTALLVPRYHFKYSICAWKSCLHFLAVSRSSSRRGSYQWSYGYRRRSSPTNLPVFQESTPGKEPSPPPSHSTDSNSSGVGNDSPPVSTAVSLYQPLFFTPSSRYHAHTVFVECYPLMWDNNTLTGLYY